MISKKVINKLFTPVIFSICLSNTANAEIWNISSIASGTDGGFGFSGFHYSGNIGNGSNSDEDAMTGSSISNSQIGNLISGGTYNDITGNFEISFELDGGNNEVAIFGDLDFTQTSTLHAEFHSALSLQSGENLTDMISLGLLAGDICCNGTYDPNGFWDLGNNTGIMSLWGASWNYGNNDDFNGSYLGSLVGLDLRLGLTKANPTPGGPANVPEPSFLLLMGFSLIGFSLRKLNKKT